MYQEIWRSTQTQGPQSRKMSGSLAQATIYSAEGHHYVCEQTSSKGREIEDARAEIINHLCKVATRERTG